MRRELNIYIREREREIESHTGAKVVRYTYTTGDMNTTKTVLCTRPFFFLLRKRDV